MTASPNDAWLRHILWQTSHHCVTKWSNIILSEAKNIISPQAMHHLTNSGVYDTMEEAGGAAMKENIHEAEYAQGTKDFVSLITSRKTAKENNK